MMGWNPNIPRAGCEPERPSVVAIGRVVAYLDQSEEDTMVDRISVGVTRMNAVVIEQGGDSISLDKASVASLIFLLQEALNAR